MVRGYDPDVNPAAGKILRDFEEDLERNRKKIISLAKTKLDDWLLDTIIREKHIFKVSAGQEKFSRILSKERDRLRKKLKQSNNNASLEQIKEEFIKHISLTLFFMQLISSEKTVYTVGEPKQEGK